MKYRNNSFILKIIEIITFIKINYNNQTELYQKILFKSHLFSKKFLYGHFFEFKGKFSIHKLI
jgi:hypothetical protein